MATFLAIYILVALGLYVRAMMTAPTIDERTALPETARIIELFDERRHAA